MMDLNRPWPLGLSRGTWWRFALVFVVLLALLAVIDRAASVYGQGLPEAAVRFFRVITDFGLSEWVLIPSLVLMLLCAGLTLVIRKWTPRLALFEMAQLYGFIFVGVGLPGLISNLIKRALGRGRPEVFDQVGAYGLTLFSNDVAYQSFPSGHTTTSFALAFVIGFISRRWFPWVLLVAAAVGVSRVVVGAHYPTDVLGGIVVGTLGAYLVRNFFASRRWVFRFDAAGRVRLRPWAAVRRLARPKRKPQPR